MSEDQSSMRPIDRIRQSHKSTRRPIEIEEWGGLTLYFGRLTPSDTIAVEERDPGSRMEKNILMIIHKAELEDGTKAFAWGDKRYLMDEGDVTVLNRVIAHMYGAALGIDLDEAGQQAMAEAIEDEEHAEEIVQRAAVAEGKDESTTSPGEASGSSSDSASETD